MTATPHPAYGNPELGPDTYDEDGEPHDFGVGWDLSWGCKVSIGYDDGQLHATVSMSDADQRAGISVRSVTAEQVRAYAHQLLALVYGAPGDEPPSPGTLATLTAPGVTAPPKPTLATEETS